MHYKNDLATHLYFYLFLFYLFLNSFFTLRFFLKINFKVEDFFLPVHISIWYSCANDVPLIYAQRFQSPC